MRKWVCPVNFFYDKELNFYWSSMLDTKHSKNISKNSDAAIAIYKTEKFPGERDDVLGLQAKGVASLVLDEEEIRKVCREYEEITQDKEKSEKMQNDFTRPGRVWHMYKFETKKMWIFDSRDFGEDRVLVDLDKSKF
jgi:nitroimidazol reductase NimA-like FMN-containing flavoprotein (pyridoxamine 5'-phosphate oxidase superfamily)